MTNLEKDLKDRWVPSPEQIALADALLAAGYDKARGERRERGVYTAHLLYPKDYGFWDTSVQIKHLDGVFLSRDAVSSYLDAQAAQHYLDTGQQTVGSWTWHSSVGHWAVFEDILARHPKED